MRFFVLSSNSPPQKHLITGKFEHLHKTANCGGYSFFKEAFMGTPLEIPIFL